MDFKDKYFKYKDKYLKLKKQIGGYRLITNKDKQIVIDNYKMAKEMYDIVSNIAKKKFTDTDEHSHLLNILYYFYNDAISIELNDNNFHIINIIFKKVKEEILTANETEFYKQLIADKPSRFEKVFQF